MWENKKKKLDYVPLNLKSVCLMREWELVKL